MKRCADCKQEKPLDQFGPWRRSADGLYYYCRDCKRRHDREYKARNRERLREAEKERRLRDLAAARALDAKNRDKKRARGIWGASQKVYWAIKKGELTKPGSCEECGRASERIQGHHEDYTQPLKVAWLCAECHGKKHWKVAI